MSRLNESSIFITLKQLRKTLYTSMFYMDKGNRIVYGTPIMQRLGDVISEFVIAFTVTEDKWRHLDLAIGYFGVVRCDLEFCMEANMFHFPKRKAVEKDENGNIIDERDTVNARKIEILQYVAKIDNEMCKWRASIAKGKSVYDNK